MLISKILYEKIKSKIEIYNFHLLTFVNVYYEDENVMFEVKNHAYFYEDF